MSKINIENEETFKANYPTLFELMQSYLKNNKLENLKFTQLFSNSGKSFQVVYSNNPKPPFVYLECDDINGKNAEFDIERR